MRRVMLTLAVGLWLAALGRGVVAQEGEHDGPQSALPTATPPAPGVTPTIDRLAAPPTVPSPTQADEGAQLFWLHCQPCHGDQGQGLTDEWRAQYPPEDQDCWTSGCHGPRPYEQGFILPTAVPAVIGEGTLSRFQTLDGVYQYVSVAMPYFFPGDLTQEEYLAIVAHLARANGLGDGAPLTLDNLPGYRLPWAAAAQSTATLPPPTPVAADQSAAPRFAGIGLAVIGGLGLLVVGGIVLWLMRGRSS